MSNISCGVENHVDFISFGEYKNHQIIIKSISKEKHVLNVYVLPFYECKEFIAVLMDFAYNRLIGDHFYDLEVFHKNFEGNTLSIAHDQSNEVLIFTIFNIETGTKSFSYLEKSDIITVLKIYE